MSLYEQWTELAQRERAEAEHKAFWNEYFDLETANYRRILSAGNPKLTGSLGALAESNGMSPVQFVGFLDGANTSLTEAVELESIEADTELDLTLDFEKLYYNMHAAKAPWLYELPEWDGVLPEEKRREIAKAYRTANIYVKASSVGRNDPCPCGSGKKYKKCCGAKLA